MKRKVLVVVSEGFEDIETVAPIDVLTRVGASVTIAAPHAGAVKGAWGTTLLADISLDDVEDDYDAVVVPGGLKNAKGLAADTRVLELLRRCDKGKKIIASLCASPSHVLGEAAGILRGRRATGDPAFNERLEQAGAVLSAERVSLDGNLITATGPGTALEFSLALAERLGYGDGVKQLAGKWGLVSS